MFLTCDATVREAQEQVCVDMHAHKAFVEVGSGVFSWIASVQELACGLQGHVVG